MQFFYVTEIHSSWEIPNTSWWMIVEKLVTKIPLTFEKPRYNHDYEVMDDRQTNIYQSISKAHNSAVLCTKTCISMYPFSEKKCQLDWREMLVIHSMTFKTLTNLLLSKSL